MNRWVIDASVAVKWYLLEPGYEKAANLLDVANGKGELAAPDLLLLEAANIFWKRIRRNELDESEAMQMLTELCGVPILLLPSTDFASDALKIACSIGCSAYDASYLAIAATLGWPLITADAALVRACSAERLSGLVRLLDDWQPTE